jgi:lipopolysaccharide transport system permease protein
MVGFAMTVVMYLTPVIYSYPTLSPRLKYWVSFNPLVAPIEMFRYAWFGIGEFSIGSFSYSLLSMLVLLFMGIVLFNKVEKNFMDTV